MKKVVLLCSGLLFLGLTGFSQMQKPVTWNYTANKTGPHEATLFITATIEEGWHLYSQKLEHGGPVKTTFDFADAKTYSVVGETVEPTPIKKFEPVFAMEVCYFEKAVVFQQKVKLKGKNVVVKGSVKFMACNDQQCTPPQTTEFVIPIQ